MTMWNDPIVDETRQVRNEIAARFDYDLNALGEYFKAMSAVDAAQLIAALLAPPSPYLASATGAQMRAGQTMREEPAGYDPDL